MAPDDPADVVELVAAGGVRMAHPEEDEDDPHRHQRRDLDDVDHDRGHRRPADAPEGDVARQRGEADGHDRQRQPCQLMVDQCEVDVAEQRGGEGHHDPGVDPVVEVADPAHRQLGRPGEPLVLQLVLVEEGGLGEVVAGTRAGIGVDPGQFGVAVGRE